MAEEQKCGGLKRCRAMSQFLESVGCTVVEGVGPYSWSIRSFRQEEIPSYNIRYCPFCGCLLNPADGAVESSTSKFCCLGMDIGVLDKNCSVEMSPMTGKYAILKLGGGYAGITYCSWCGVLLE